jgi:hypothetical protein
MSRTSIYDRGPSRGDVADSMKWGCAIIVVIAALSLIGVYAHFALGWLAEPARVIGVDNTRQQWAFAYQYDESLHTIANQYCTAATAVAQSDPVTKPQRESQRIAIENNYNRVRAEYDAKLRDAFQAKLVKPPDVPDRAPALQENVARWCR